MWIRDVVFVFRKACKAQSRVQWGGMAEKEIQRGRVTCTTLVTLILGLVREHAEVALRTLLATVYRQLGELAVVTFCRAAGASGTIVTSLAVIACPLRVRVVLARLAQDRLSAAPRACVA